MRVRWPVGVVLVATITFAVALSAGGAGIVPPNHPRANLTAVPKYSIVSGKSYVVGRALPPCWTWSTSHQLIPRSTTALCVKDEIAATNRAQSSEHLGPMTLPSNFASLSAPEQLLVTVDLERVSRGETPVAGVSASLDALAQSAAVARQDPSLPSASSYPGATGGYVANWAGALSALDANYDWMYLDGWAGSATFNYDCTSAQAAGCWGHRDNILVNGSRMPCLVASCSLVMGGGYVYLGAGQDFSSFSELIVQVNGAPSDLYYSWATAVADGAKP